MNSLAAYIAPLALLFPAGSADAPILPLGGGEQAMSLSAEMENLAPPLMMAPPEAAAMVPLSDAALPPEQAQVRIEQVVTIRISPRPNTGRQDLLAQIPQGRNATRIEQRKIGSCLPADAIVGVQTGGNSDLVLFMRDRRVISVALEKSCNARDFYSGFYVERSRDGQLCVKRDKIHSRAGVKCEMRQIRQLVAVRD